jgi:ubiquinol-cytochrome c reductase iron-sulfur subunit
MSDSTHAIAPHDAPGDDDVDQSRRNLLVATCVAGGAASAAVAWPFLASMQPSERARALGAPVEADISGLEAGQMLVVEWQGKPVWVLRRNQAMLDTLTKDAAQLADPNSKRSQQPEYAQNIWRAREEKKDILVTVGICTHLGCSPVPKFAPGDPGMGASWPGGFLCPCHGSRFDLSARVYANFPAPDNLPIPRYKFLSDQRVLIGDDKA